MSAAADMLGTLRNRGINVALAGADMLRASGPLTAEDRARLVEQKPAILEHLRARAAAGFLPCGHRLGPGETAWGHAIRDAVVSGDDVAIARLHAERAAADPAWAVEARKVDERYRENRRRWAEEAP